MKIRKDARGAGDGSWYDYVLSLDKSERGDQTSDADVASTLNRAFSLHMANLHRRPTLDVDVVSHCNLNCASCRHFSPISDPNYLALEDYERDLVSLAKVDGVEEFFHTICLMGGEPLLHPDLPALVEATRRRLPRIGIRLVTNGLLLDEAPAELWDTLRDAEASVLITPYPTGLDYGHLASSVADKGVRVYVGGGLTREAEGDVFFLRTPLDPAGIHDPVEAFVSCVQAGSCMQLRDGRIYPCDIGTRLDVLNNRFDTDFRHEPADYLELASIRCADEIDTFRRTSKPMCRYCALALTKRVVWHKSAGAIEEWLVTEKERR